MKSIDLNPEQTTKFRVLDRKKPDPGKFVFTGVNHAEKIDLQLFKYNEAECTETTSIPLESLVGFDQAEYRYWLNVHGLNNPETIARICKKVQIDDLVIQDILDINQRPKYQEFENFSFFTFKSIVPSGKNLVTEQISVIFGTNYLMSFQEKRSKHFEHLRFRLREKLGILRGKGPDILLFSLLEAIMDNYFKTLQKLDNDVDGIYSANFESDPSPSVIKTIEQFKKQVHIIRKAIQPIKEFTLTIERGQSKYIEPRHIKYFLEIKDLAMTLLDNCDTIEHLLESRTNLFFSVQGHRMNQVMKTLTIIASIFIPLTFITSIYGMNFEFMPELQWKYGYHSIWILLIFCFTGMLIYLRRRKWF